MKAKDWAVTQGLATPGRGRMSREAHAAIQEAIAGGMTFSDYKGAPSRRGTQTPLAKMVRAKRQESEKQPTDVVENTYAGGFFRYPMDQIFTYTDDNGKTHEISSRPACMNCGYSLVGHTCNDPVVLTYHGARSVKPKGE